MWTKNVYTYAPFSTPTYIYVYYKRIPNIHSIPAHESHRPAESGHYTVMWTTKTGGWPRYINTNLAGLYRLVFGINEVKGVTNNDFRFIPNKKPEAVAPDATAATANDQEPLNR